MLQTASIGKAMKMLWVTAGVFVLVTTVDSVFAVTRYVDVNCAQPTSPYTNWSTAARTIQSAIDAAASGDFILVTNGNYQTGGTSNRVTINKPVVIESVNGPSVTTIRGFQPPVSGVFGIRCVYMTNGAALNGFTLTEGSAKYGGGIWCESTNAFISNCVFSNNHAGLGGGGVSGGTLTNCLLISNSVPMGAGAGYTGGGVTGSVLNNCTLIDNVGALGGAAAYSTLNNCMISGNIAVDGGGAYSSTLNNCAVLANMAGAGGGTYQGFSEPGSLNNCTLVGNSASSTGGGIYGGAIRNCIIYYNTAPSGPNYSSATLNYCCATPQPAGTGNISTAPRLADLFHLSPDSPCRGKGSLSYATGLDVDREVWANPPSIGCDEFYAGSVTGQLSVAIQASYTNVSIGFVVNFQAQINGHPTISRWDYGDGTVVSNQLLFASHSWPSAGDYTVTFSTYNDSYPAGVNATLTMHVTENPVHYVALNCTNPVWPYMSWETAATNIQDAVDAAFPLGAVIVSNGVYRTGGRAAYGALTNRVAVTKPLTLRSVNGPDVTVIQGFQLPGKTNGDGAIRCVYLTNGASFSGFTLTGGATRTNGDSLLEQSGGGLFCATNIVVTNCVFMNNSANQYGGGTHRGFLKNCRFSGNTSGLRGGAVSSATLDNCMLSNNSAGYAGGGAYSSTLSNSTVMFCSGHYSSGAAESSTLVNCLIASNRSDTVGGASDGATANRCVFIGNSSANGGAVGNGTINNSLLIGNSATDGGAAWGSATLNQCTIVSNSAANSGGGIYGCTVNNSILYDNISPSGPNFADSSLHIAALVNCCATPLPGSGSNNITSPPMFVNPATGDYHLQAASPCINAGNNSYVSSSTDLDGNPRIVTTYVDMGAYEFQSVAPIPLSLNIQATYTNVAAGFTVYFTVQITGHGSIARWDYGDGTVVNTTSLSGSHNWSGDGDYVVTVWGYNESYPEVSASTVIHVTDHPVYFVSLANTSPLAPYQSWATAAATIQEAINAAAPGATILVSNGVYQTGGTSNRVTVNKLLTLRSVNGPAFTIIDGANQLRCAYLINGAILDGFTLTRGWTPLGVPGSGAGVRCESTNCLITNCVLSANESGGEGGGAYQAKLLRCIIDGNSASAYAGGASRSVLDGCRVFQNVANNGGGTAWSIMNRCIVEGNIARDGGGGGAYGGTLANCIVVNNQARYGGGVVGETLVNCTVVNNVASTAQGGGTYSGTLVNCVVYDNLNSDQPGDPQDYYGGAFTYCCTVPLPAGSGNITNPPLFIGESSGNFRLQSNSPCINIGRSASVLGNMDLDGRSRIVGGRADIGAYEFQGSGIGELAGFLQQYGLATDGSADFADTDGDLHNNWQEWHAGTIPTNSASVLKLLSPTNDASGVVLNWQSVAGKTYFLERAVGIGVSPSLLPLASNILGQANTTSYIDANATGDGSFIYRVGVQE